MGTSLTVDLRSNICSQITVRENNDIYESVSWINAWKYPISQNVSKWAKHQPAEDRKVTVAVVTGPTK